MSAAAAAQDESLPVVIGLKVNGQFGSEVFLRMKRSTHLQQLMETYCQRRSVNVDSVEFRFNGAKLRGEQTPNELEMEDGDEIDAVLHSKGCSIL